MGKCVRIIISGSRRYNNFNIFSECITNLILKISIKDNLDPDNDIIEIITGMAVGTDLMAIKYVYLKPEYDLIKLVPFEPKFWIHGDKAGEIRNKEMAEYAIKGDSYYLYAFWNGNNGGTKHMIDTAALYNIPIYIHRIQEEYV